MSASPSELPGTEDHPQARMVLGAALREGLAGTSVELPSPAFEGADHVYHLFIVRSAARDALRAHLETYGVSSAVHYPFPTKDLVTLDDALKYGSRAARARFAVYLGDLGADTAATARDILTRVPTPEIQRGSTRLTRLEDRPAPSTMPNENGRNAKPACSEE